MHVESNRIEKSLELEATEIGRGKFLVTGGSEPHYVDLHSEPHCDCGDHIWRGSTCKHILASKLLQGDKEALGRLRVFVRELKEKLSKEAHAS